MERSGSESESACASKEKAERILPQRRRGGRGGMRKAGRCRKGTQHKEGREGAAEREFNTRSEKFIHTNHKSRITNHGRAKRDSTQWFSRFAAVGVRVRVQLKKRERQGRKRKGREQAASHS